LLISIPFKLFAQSFTPDPDWRFENFNSQNHFSSGPVSQMVIDKKGYIWASSTSLQRFDGNHTIYFGRDNQSNTGLRGNYSGLVCDNNGDVWITCYGLCRYDEASGKFVYVKTDPKHNFRDAESFSIRGDYIWFICEFGLAKFDTRTLRTTFTSLTHVYDPLCTAFINDSTLFVSSREKVYFYNVKRDTWTSRTLVYNQSLLKVFCIHKVKDSFFLGTNNGLFLLDHGNEIVPKCPQTRDIIINDFAVLQADREQKYLLLAAEGRGIQVYNTESEKIEFGYLHDDNNPYSIPCNGISSFFTDSKGRLWIASDIGLSMLDLTDQRFKMRFLDKSNAYQLGINKIAADRYDSTKVWMCSYNQGMICLNWKTKQVEKMYNQVPFARRLYDFAQVSKDRWLLATQKELIEWNPVSGPINRLKLPIPDSLALICNIRRIIMADASTCFITTNHGLFKYDLMTRRVSYASEASKPRKDSDPLKYILLEGFRDNDMLWIASRNGVVEYHLKDGSIAVYRGPGSMGDYFLYDVAKASDDQLICAAGQGITIFNLRTKDFSIIHSLGNAYKPGCGSVIALNKTVWIGSDVGIFTYDLGTHKTRQAELNNTVSDIFPSSQFTTIGKYIVYGFRNGFAYFLPEIKTNPAPSDPVIERIFVNNQPLLKSYQKNTPLEFSHSENSLNFAFTSFLYNYPDDIRFRYRLKAIDRGWQNAGDQRGANYTQLPAGEYTFYVQCGNRNGLWNNHVASFAFTIEPPYWATWWFRSSVVLLIAFALYRLYRYKIEHLQAIEQIRANIAADFHDDLGSTLSSISIFSQVAIQKAETDLVTTKSMVSDIGTRARAMIHSMNDMVWIIKPENDSLFKLMQRMEEFGYPVAEAKEIPLSFVMDKGLYNIKLDMLHRKNLFLIFKEAFNNAVKYACPKDIVVQFELKQKKVLAMKIADNGCGFDCKNSKKGNGLGNMQKRAAEIKGKLKIISAPDCGTSVNIVCEIT
jgi:signal transduction histidine kinase/ligand-binding sensor domain-containing protein